MNGTTIYIYEGLGTVQPYLRLEDAYRQLTAETSAPKLPALASVKRNLYRNEGVFSVADGDDQWFIRKATLR